MRMRIIKENNEIYEEGEIRKKIKKLKKEKCQEVLKYNKNRKLFNEI